MIISGNSVVRFLVCAAAMTVPSPLAGQARPAPDAAPTIEVRTVRPVARPAWVTPDVPDTVWLLVEQGAHEPDAERSRAVLRDAEALARALLAERPEDVGRRYGLAAVLGMRAEREGGREKIRAASALHDELETILALDPDHAGGHHMMGRLHAGVRRMNGVVRWLATRLLGGDVLARASWAEAERHLVQAEERAPGVPDHHLQLAKLYRDTGRPELARAELDHVLDGAARSPLERAARLEATRLIADMDGT